MHAMQLAAELGDDMHDEISSYDGTDDGNAVEVTDPPKLIISGCELSSWSTKSEVAPSSPSAPFRPLIFKSDAPKPGSSWKGRVYRKYCSIFAVGSTEGAFAQSGLLTSTVSTSDLSVIKTTNVSIAVPSCPKYSSVFLSPFSRARALSTTVLITFFSCATQRNQRVRSRRLKPAGRARTHRRRGCDRAHTRTRTRTHAK